jgi:hypothetical protein
MALEGFFSQEQFDMDDHGALYENFASALTSEEHAQRAYAFCLMNYDVRREDLERIRETTGIGLSEKVVQQAYADILDDDFFSEEARQRINKIYEATGIAPELNSASELSYGSSVTMSCPETGFSYAQDNGRDKHIDYKNVISLAKLLFNKATSREMRKRIMDKFLNHAETISEITLGNDDAATSYEGLVSIAENLPDPDLACRLYRLALEVTPSEAPLLAYKNTADNLMQRDSPMERAFVDLAEQFYRKILFDRDSKEANKKLGQILLAQSHKLSDSAFEEMGIRFLQPSSFEEFADGYTLPEHIPSNKMLAENISLVQSADDLRKGLEKLPLTLLALMDIEGMISVPDYMAERLGIDKLYEFDEEFKQELVDVCMKYRSRRHRDEEKYILEEPSYKRF